MKISRCKISLLFLSMFWVGCTTTPPPEPEPPKPLALPVGIVRSLNLAERYLVFEAEFRVPEGSELTLLQDGVPAGKLQAGAYRRQKFQSADILEGRPNIGDLVEPVLSGQPLPSPPGQQGSGQ